MPAKPVPKPVQKWRRFPHDLTKPFSQVAAMERVFSGHSAEIRKMERRFPDEPHRAWLGTEAEKEIDERVRHEIFGHHGEKFEQFMHELLALGPNKQAASFVNFVRKKSGTKDPKAILGDALAAASGSKIFAGRVLKANSELGASSQKPTPIQAMAIDAFDTYAREYSGLLDNLISQIKPRLQKKAPR